MRPNRLLDSARWLRGLAIVGIVVLGVISIVGSGGGAGFGLPGDCPPGADCSAPPPLPAVDVQPSHVTVLVGTSVTYSAETSNIPVSGSPTFQWSRSSDGGATYSDIAGATSSTYSLASANLGDDRAIFQVTMRNVVNGEVRAAGHLAVSASPGLVFEDGDFQPAAWQVTPLPQTNGAAPVQTAERVATGGHPDAYRKMVFTISPQEGSTRVLNTSIASTYDPQSQGAIYVIDYAEDGISLQPNDLTSTTSAMLLEQSSRKYIANVRDNPSIIPTTWSNVGSRSSLRPEDFNLIDGPACQAGESCPDFSALGSSMRFGYWRISFGTQGQAIAHGIDNWKVTVWRR